MWQRHARPVTRCVFEIEPELVSGVKLDRAVEKSTYAKFWALQIDHDSDGTADIAFDIPDHVEATLVIVVGPVAEIQSEHIDAGIEKGSDHRRRRTGGSKRRNDFRVP